MAADRMKTKSPVIEKETAYNALQKVVGKAHLSYTFKTGNCFPDISRIVNNDINMTD